MRTEEIAKLSPSHTESNQPGDKKPDNNQSENHGTDERPDRVKPEISSTGEDKPEAGKPFIKDKSGQERHSREKRLEGHSGGNQSGRGRKNGHC